MRHPTQERVAGLAEAIRQDPDQPLMLRCNLGDVCAYQNCGTAEDTPEGPDVNRKRDADLLQWLDLPPGTVLPARLLLKRLLFRLPMVGGICGYARDMFRLILERIPSTDGVCALNRIPLPEHSVWLDGCHSMTFPGPYEKGQRELWSALGCAGTPVESRIESEAEARGAVRPPPTASPA